MRSWCSRPGTALRTVAAAAVLGGLLAGCGVGATDGATAGPADGATAGAAAEGDRVDASVTPARAAATPAPAPSLPPGDPGLEAPGIPMPETDAPAPAVHEEEARQEVPLAAMLDLPTMSMVVGGAWQRRPGGADECLRPEAATGERTMSYGGNARGRLVETVATYPDVDEADAAVAALADAAAGCGWTLQEDPRLGSASVAAVEGPRTMVAVSAEEGVLVLLVATGDYARDQLTWGSLVDLASGSSCPAGPEGCH